MHFPPTMNPGFPGGGPGNMVGPGGAMPTPPFGGPPRAGFGPPAMFPGPPGFNGPPLVPLSATGPQSRPVLPFRPALDPMMMMRLHEIGLEPRVTDVWVGKISPLVEDFVIRQLLDACGFVANWQRVAANGVQKNFGFCKFANAEGALRAMRLLNGLEIGGEKLHLKVDQSTTDYLEGYEKKKRAFLETDTEFKLADLQILDSSKFDQIANETITSLTSKVTKLLSEDAEGNGVVSKETRIIRERQLNLERERREREAEIERKKQRDEEEEKHRLRRQQEREERDFKDRERKWSDYERDRDRSRKAYFDDVQERVELRKQWLILDEEDEKSHRKKIKSRDARKKRQREKEMDESERAKEEQEREMLRKEEERRKKEEEEKKKLMLIEMAERVKAESERMQAEKARLERQQAEKQQVEAARLERLKGSKFAEIEDGSNAMAVEDKKPSTLFSLNPTALGSKKAALTPSNSIFSAVVDDSEDSNLKKKRKLMVLEHEVGNHAGEERPLDAKAATQAIVDKIPTQKEDLFKFEIDWEVVEAQNVIESKMRPWVKKKVVEFLGDEEQDLIDFVCRKLGEQMAPSQLAESLALVLEDEATEFVIRMWRMLIFNILTIKSEMNK